MGSQVIRDNERNHGVRADAREVPWWIEWLAHAWNIRHEQYTRSLRSHSSLQPDTLTYVQKPR